MDGKILVFFKDFQLNRQVLSCINQLGLSFVECFREEELAFKSQLFEQPNKMFIYEFLNDNDSEQFHLLEKMKSKGFKVLVIFPKYSIKYIDEGQKVGINDMLVHPIDVNTLKNKIASLMNLPIEIEKVEEQVVKESSYLDIVDNEISRARRGQYDLSFVLFSFVSVADERLGRYFEKLEKSLRETDIILSTTEKNKYLLVCPFTKKNFLVEVENKVREAFDELKRSGMFLLNAKIYIHGLTLGVDGSSFKELMDKMSKGIEDSKLLDQVTSKNFQYRPNDKLKAYNRFYKWN